MAGRLVRRAPHKRSLLIALLVVLIGGISVVVIVARDIALLTESLAAMQSAAKRSFDNAAALRFNTIKEDLTIGSNAAKALKNAIDTSLYFKIPYDPIRKQADAGREISIHIRRSFDALLPLAHRLDSIADHILESQGSSKVKAMSDDDRKVVLEQLSILYPELVGARASLALTEERMKSGLSDTLGMQAQSSLSVLAQRVEHVRRSIDDALVLVEFLPSFLASGTEKTYLILMQNNTEVRPTGGFIGTYGIITFRDGSVVKLETDNVYNLDDVSRMNVAPPQPLAEYGPIKRWYLRDSNWSPDFAQSAQQAITFFRSEGGREAIDGVIALTPDVIASLMRILGPVSVDDLNFHPDQFAEELEYQVEKGYERRGIAKKDRKDVIRLIANDLFAKLSHLSVYDWQKIGALLDARRSDKHLMMYFTDRDSQRTARALAMSGEVLQFEGDYLMVVDANILSLKTDRVMDKKITYAITEHKDGSLTGTVALTYRNNGMFSWTTTTYRDYVRILIPDGCIVLGVDGAQMPLRLVKRKAKVDISRKHGKLMLGAYIEVPPQTEHTITFRYTLPNSIASSISEKGLYQLFVQKQSGVDTQQLNIQASFQKNIKQIEPVGFLDSRTNPTSVELHANLQTDKRYAIFF